MSSRFRPRRRRSKVELALEAGYRSIDTAAAYGNEEGVGAALAASGLPREELFVTTKLWNAHHGHDSTLRAFDASLERLGLDYVDLYLIHWPVPARGPLRRHLAGLREDLRRGAARTIGVSNFRIEHLERLLGEAATRAGGQPDRAAPAAPAGRAARLARRARHRHRGLEPARAGQAARRPGRSPRIAERHGKTPAQVVLRWHLQIGNVVIPKSVTPARIRENIDVFDFELSPREMAAIGDLNRGGRIGPEPATFGG